MAYEFYNAYNSIISTPAEKFRSDLQSVVNSQFEIASDYFIIQRFNRISGTPTDLGVRLTVPYHIKGLSTIKDDYRQILFKSNDIVNHIGDLYSFNDYYYMVIDTGRVETPTNSCIVQRCNVHLKFTESTPLTSNVMNIWGIASRYYIGGLSTDSYIKLPDDQLDVIIPNDPNGRKIKYTTSGGTRFLLGNPYQNWRVTNYDNISKVRPTTADVDTNGLISLQLTLSEINTSYDDLTYGVAWQDYFGLG